MEQERPRALSPVGLWCLDLSLNDKGYDSISIKLYTNAIYYLPGCGIYILNSFGENQVELQYLKPTLLRNVSYHLHSTLYLH